MEYLKIKGVRIADRADSKRVEAVTDASRAKSLTFPASTCDHNLVDKARVRPFQAGAKSKPQDQ